MAATAKQKRKKTKGNAAGRALVESAQQLADALESGDTSTLTIRKIEVTEPHHYSPAEVKALREKMDVSQPLFARIIGVSATLARQWEYGLRTPAPLAARLMDIISEDTAGFVAKFIRTRRA